MRSTFPAPFAGFPQRTSVKRLYRWALPAVAPALAACLSVAGPPGIGTLPEGGHHVLFIGNSLTYTNDLPGTVAALAQLAGDTIRVGEVALPNFAVIDHAKGMSNAVDVIESQPWELVVLQQGPTTTPLNRDTLIIATKALDPLVKAAGGRTAQLMTWPQAAFPQQFPLVRSSSLAAANSVEGGVFIPAGEAWRIALERDPAINLYGPDGYHPGPLGTYLAALVIYEKVTGHDARKLPGTALVGGVTLTVPEATVRFLQSVAHEVVGSF
jgi:hypothetical protein